MKTNLFNRTKVIAAVVVSTVVGLSASAQTTIYQTIQASPNHTILEQAVDAAGLDGTLDAAGADLTVFAPDDDAFNAAFNELGITAGDLLADPNLGDILTYHVLNGTIASSGLSNALIETPLNTANTLKFTIDGGDAYVNQSLIDGADIPVTNGALHSVDAVVFADQTVADVIINSADHTVLEDAIFEARLMPALIDPFASLTVFGPTDVAFNDALAELGISAGDLLADPNLGDILLHHVLGVEATSGDINNGDYLATLNASNTLKVTSNGNTIAINQAIVTAPDNGTSNGQVHVIDAVLFANTTVADVVINSADHTILEDALIEARLLSSLTDPFASYTVFGPTDAAFNQFLSDEGITAGDLLADPNLPAILLYHVLGIEVVSGDLMNGPVTTLNGADIVVDLSNGVMINSAMVTNADIPSENGVVHVIDYVLNPAEASIEELEMETLELYPNPATTEINVKDVQGANYSIVNMAGSTVKSGTINGTIKVESLEEGTYFINIEDETDVYKARFIKM